MGNTLSYGIINKYIRYSIPEDIFNELTPVALAHIIMCDGSGLIDKRLTICTDAFSLKDVVLLINVLYIKYNISSSINRSKGKPLIYISGKEMHKLRKIVDEYTIPFFSYKFRENIRNI
jgi:hypothetical protein